MTLRTSKIHSVLLIGLTLTMMGCGKGFNAASESTTDGNSVQGDVPGGDTPPDTSKQAWSDVSNGVEGKVDGGTYNQSLVVKIDKERKALVLLLPLPPIFLLPSLNSMPIPELAGASVELVTQADGSLAMGVVIPLQHIVKGTTLGDYGKLPSGDPIPFIPAGEARGLAVSFPQKPSYRLHIYLTVNAAAAFIETPDFDLPFGFGFPVKNKAKTQVVGYLSVVPTKASFSSGVYVATRLPNKMAILIDELLKF